MNQGRRHPDIERMYAALYGPPMSADEIATFNSLRAKEMAKAEALRNPSPQLDLDCGFAILSTP